MLGLWEMHNFASMRPSPHILVFLWLFCACKGSVDGSRRITRSPQSVAWVSQQESFAVWESGQDDAWVSQREGLLHWDGSSLELVFPSKRLYASLWGASATDIWAAGYQRLAHWDGQSWYPIEGDWPLYGVGGSGPSDVWAVGCESPEPGRDLAAVFHWNGTKWSQVILDDDLLQSCPRRVWGSGPDDFWMAGVGIVAHWDGKAWSRASLPIQDALFTGLWGTSATDVWTISGHEREGDVHPWHWDGKSWTRFDLDTRRGFEMWGRSPNDYFSGGDSLFHWNGNAWLPIRELPFQSPINAIHGGGSDIWVVGFEGALRLVE